MTVLLDRALFQLPSCPIKAWFVLTLERGRPTSLDVKSEWPLSRILGSDVRHVLVAKTARGASFAEAKQVIEGWWRSRRPWQKRAYLHNAFLRTWKVPEV